MAYTSEIDKLERRHRENPEGRTFAPLADAYRKAGDVPRALEVLKAGLQLHPDYLSASIVLGRCHLDLGDLGSAEAAFRRVLELDKENVIAIKALADITERQTRFGESEDWLNYLLSIDSSNEDARLQLTRLGIIREQHERSSVEIEEPAAKTDKVPAVTAEDLEAAEVSAAPVPDDSPDLEDTVEIPPARPPYEAMQSAVTESVDVGTANLDEIFALAEQRVDAEPESEPDLEPEVPQAPVSSYDPADVGVMSLEVDLPTSSGADENFVVGVEKNEEIVLRPSSTSEFQVPSDAEILAGGSGSFAPSFEEDLPAAMAPHSEQSAEPEPELEPEPEPEPEPEAEPEPAVAQPTGLEHFEEFLPPAAPEPEPIEDEPIEDEALEEEPALEPVVQEQPLVTETMGDVYAAQGHHAEAREVYRQLLLRSPEDERLREKMAQLERRTPPAAAHRKGFGAADTGGRSVSAYFGDLLSARLGESGNGMTTEEPPADDMAPTPSGSTPVMEEAFGEPDASSGGEPTRPANEPLSLSAIFGEDSSPIPPVVAGPESEAADRKPGSSFDEFFGERPAPPAGGSRPRTIRTSDSDTDDLEQFHKWLKGLKR
jgi:tetratricopeptide (TPR) repeat protein